MPTLFDPIAIGDLRLPNRIFMAPLSAIDRTVEGASPTP
jgi:2,4-dienoyl-CoA reductase-like NADH-dependent reductase (Old Yellow Enzyme family)